MPSSPKHMDHINAALATTGYYCRLVSLDCKHPEQVSNTGTSSVCYWPTNISDVYLKAKDDTPLYTIRNTGWNRKFLEVCNDDVTLLIGNCDGGGELHSITLRKFLEKPAEFGAGYTGIDTATRLPAFPDVVNVQFETVFFPVEWSDDERADMQFAVETYSKAVQSEEDPRNLILVASTKGLSVQADGKNATKVMLHMGSKNEVNEYWFKMQTSKSNVDEQKDATTNGDDGHSDVEAESKGIGIKGVEMQSNVLMAIQVPLVQNQSMFASTPFAKKLVNAVQTAPGPSSAPPGVNSDSALPPKQVSNKPPSGVFGSPFNFAGGSSAASSTLPNDMFGSPVSFASSTPPSDWFGSPVNFAKASANSGVTSQTLFSTPSGSSVEGSSAVPPKQVSNTSPTINPFDSFSSNSWAKKTSTPSTESVPKSIVQGSAINASFANLSRPTVGQDRNSSPIDNTDANVEETVISCGDFYAKHNGLSKKVLKRNWEKVTITFIIVKVIVGGMPSEAEVLAAVADMDVLYEPRKESMCRKPLFTFAGQDISGLRPSQNNKKSSAPRNHHASRSVQTPSPPPVPAPVMPSASSRLLHLQSARNIVSNKLKGFESMHTISESALLELKLLIFGALQLENVKALLESKFDTLERRRSSSNSCGTKDLLLELELLILGSFESSIPRNNHVQTSSPPVHAPVIIPSASSRLLRLQSARNIVTNKLKEFEIVQTIGESALLELKLLTFGALQLENVKTLLESKFDTIERSLSAPNSCGAKDMLLELELLVLGSFDLLKRDVSRKESSAA